MKKTVIPILLALVLASSAYAQTDVSYLRRYNSLISRVGHNGLGVATLLGNWERADSSDVNMMLGWYNYHIACAERDSLIKTYEPRYLGAKPVMTLKDSLGRAVNFFNVTFYEEQSYGRALHYLDRATSSAGTRIDYAMVKANSLLEYEKGSPDLAKSYIISLIRKNFTKGNVWEYPGEKVDADFFAAEIQGCCNKLFNTGTPACLEAFREISAEMLRYEKNRVLFIDNLGAYCLRAKNNSRAATKYFKKSISIDPDDATAKANMELISRREALAKAHKKSGKK